MKQSEQPDIASEHIDISSLSSLIIELTISLRTCKSYPAGHPVIETSLRKVITIYDKLLENCGDISIGVAKDTLMIGTATLEKTNRVFRDFAHILFGHSIGVLTLRPGLTAAELKNFNTILGLKREEVNRHGGIQALWEKARITAMTIKAIRYDLFTASDSAPDDNDEGIWSRFARSLMAEDMDSTGEGQAGEDIDPEMLATLLNDRFSGNSTADGAAPLLEPLIDSMHRADIHGGASKDFARHAKKLGVFVNNLNADLRRQFLSSTFDIRKLDGGLAAEDIVENMSTDAVLETLDDLNQHNVNIPPVIMGLLQKLSRHGTNAHSSSHLAHMTEDDFHQKMHTIFKEHASEEFIPDDYQQKLNTLISLNQIPQLVPDDINELLATVEETMIENSISDIILNIVTAGGETLEERDFLIQSLSDMFGYFLQTGNHDQLVKMIERTSDESFPVDIQYHLRENYARREFLEEILRGLTIWGKPRYNDIKLLISKIRSPFIEVLLDHLAVEENLSLRRFMMDRLIEMGPMTRVPISIRLNDDRWFVLRNLIIILRSHADASIIPLIRPLTQHSNHRVRHEALSTMVMLHDAAAERQVLRDLESNDRDIIVSAISLAEKSRLPEIHKKLISILTNSGLSQHECDVRAAAAKVLGEMNSTEALTEFAKILASISLFNGKNLNRLKIDIIRALEHYPPPSVLPLLERLCSGKSEIALQAQESIRNIKARTHGH